MVCGIHKVSKKLKEKRNNLQVKNRHDKIIMLNYTEHLNNISHYSEHEVNTHHMLLFCEYFYSEYEKMQNWEAC